MAHDTLDSDAMDADSSDTDSKDAAGPPPPWRKRHPVISRLVLYVLGLGLGILLLVLLVERKETDEADRMQALSQELDALDLVHMLDPEGDQVIALLDEKFSDPDLPVRIRGRALRWRALAWRKKQDPSRVEAYLKEADALDLDSLERAGLHLEWAEARLAIWDADGALEVLPDVRVVAAHPALALLRAFLFAQARKQTNETEAGLADLRESLAALAAPLDATERSVYVGGKDWTGAQAATVATEYLVTVGGAAGAPAAWRLLQRLAARDFQAQVACTRGFLTLGLTEEARTAWDVARRLDPRLADAAARKDTALAGLR